MSRGTVITLLNCEDQSCMVVASYNRYEKINWREHWTTASDLAVTVQLARANVEIQRCKEKAVGIRGLTGCAFMSTKKHKEFPRIPGLTWSVQFLTDWFSGPEANSSKTDQN